jgi:FkbM family methyltransferase
VDGFYPEGVRFYSQSGEDFLLDKIFWGKTDGFFVEVGCIDGRRFSNTLIFEERGWRGLCIEAHERYVDLIEKNRPHSVVCHCAAGEADNDNVTFYANSRGSLSTLDPSLEEEFRRDYGSYFTGFVEQTVRKRRLDTVFREQGVGKIDLLSIDIEGYELPALRGMEFREWKPAVIVIETSVTEESRLHRALTPHGYHFLCRLGGNAFYALDKSLRERVAEKYFPDVQLVHTRHPLDAGDDNVVSLNIDTRGQNDSR